MKELEYGHGAKIWTISTITFFDVTKQMVSVVWGLVMGEIKAE